MTRKRKRAGSSSIEDFNKRAKVLKDVNQQASIVRRSLLPHYYANVLTLREYLLSKLPTTSKIRRRKVASAGLRKHSEHVGRGDDAAVRLAQYLDTTIVGELPLESAAGKSERIQECASFLGRFELSEMVEESSLIEGQCSQSEVCHPSVCLISIDRIVKL
jgi:telomerase reverse transcriptase